VSNTAYEMHESVIKVGRRFVAIKAILAGIVSEIIQDDCPQECDYGNKMIEADRLFKFFIKYIGAIEYDGENRDFIHDITGICIVCMVYDRGYK
jgi:hypothetical protein